MRRGGNLTMEEIAQFDTVEQMPDNTKTETVS